MILTVSSVYFARLSVWLFLIKVKTVEPIGFMFLWQFNPREGLLCCPEKDYIFV